MRVLIGLAGLIFVVWNGYASAQEIYRLQANDRIEIWTSVEPSLRRTAALGPDGWLALPLVGHVQAAGLTAPELEAALQDRLKDFYTEAIDLTVMLQPSEERAETVYVTGEVETPGAYPFRPGMIVLQSVSMAGGLQRGAARESDEERLVTQQGQVVRDAARLRANSATILRIKAEVEGTDLPAEEGDLSAALDQERQILAARRAEETTLRNASEAAIALRTRSVEVMREQATTLERRIEIAERRMSAVGELTARGFANEAQHFALEGDVVELRERQLELQSTILTAEMEMAAERASLETRLGERRTLLETELRDAEREGEVLRSQIAESERVLALLARGRAPAVEEPTRSLVYTIIRTVGGSTVAIDATELSGVEAGDLISVGYENAGAMAGHISTSDIGGTTSPAVALR